MHSGSKDCCALHTVHNKYGQTSFSFCLVTVVLVKQAASAETLFIQGCGWVLKASMGVAPVAGL